MSSNTFSQTFRQLYEWLFNIPDSSSDPRRILATGKWRQFETRRILLEAALNHPVTCLTQEEEGKLQALCAFNIMESQGYISENDEKEFYLFIGAGRGSTQMTVMNYDGEVVQAFNIETGYPKEGSPNIGLLRETALKVFEIYADNINLIVGFDSIYHVLKHDCPVVPDEGALPVKVTTNGGDFLKLGYLTDLYKNTPMIVVRNFITRDGELRKISFATGSDLLIDLGSGNANLVDPVSGQQLSNRELPSDWMTNDESLLEVASSLHSLLNDAEEFDAMPNDTDSESE